MAVNRNGRTGRPSIKLTPELQERICEALTSCCRLSVAASICGISHATLMKWVREGRARPGTKFGRFARAIRAAEDQAEAGLAALIRRNAPLDTRDAHWLLTHRPRWKDAWADKSKHEISGKLTVAQANDPFEALALALTRFAPRGPQEDRPDEPGALQGNGTPLLVGGTG